MSFDIDKWIGFVMNNTNTVQITFVTILFTYYLLFKYNILHIIHSSIISF